ncbi:hypothetical protein RB195_018930 [Necator americanus]|uniref:CCHC-type domain-containing protein n=1 Tax=Necator americanus TaxID=51031 RepID=A0ABR1CBV1_NECAM
MDELRRVKRELKRLRTAIPPLPTPDTLYDDMVDNCRNIMRTIESLDGLRSDIEYFYNSNLRYGELKREAQILERKAEICKLKFQSLRQHLRLLFSVVPILKAMSALAWRAKMQEPQSYVRRDGQEKELLTSQKEIEIIVNDQLQGMNEFFTAIRGIRSSCLNMERGQKESLNVRILETVQFISATVTDIKEQMERVGANQVHDEAQPTTSSSTLGDNFSQTVESCQMATNEKDRGESSEQAKIASNAEYMEAVEMEYEKARDDPKEAAIRAEIKSLETELTNVQKRLRELARKRTCRQREYEAGVYRTEERKMRCVFCGEQGLHYSDSCSKMRTGAERSFLRKGGRCFNCLELHCVGGFQCVKYRLPCFHCKERGHHSATCELLETSVQTGVEKLQCELAIDNIFRRLRQLRKRDSEKS